MEEKDDDNPLSMRVAVVVAILGILKAGGAWLPLDPGQPAERVATMLEDAGQPLLLTGRDLEALLAEEEGDLTAADPGNRAAPENLAYVIHTSGSSGRPKAVRVSHGNLASAYQAWRAEYRLDSEARVHLQMAGPSFDVFTGDVVRALCSGGSLVLVGDPGRAYLPEGLIQRAVYDVPVIEELESMPIRRTTVWQVTAS